MTTNTLRDQILEQSQDGTLMTPDQRLAWDGAFARVLALLDAQPPNLLAWCSWDAAPPPIGSKIALLANDGYSMIPALVIDYDGAGTPHALDGEDGFDFTGSFTEGAMWIPLPEDYALAFMEASTMTDQCRKCGGQMRPGIAMGQTFTGTPDDLGGNIVTMSSGGPGVVIGCRKCADCGWSVSR